MLKLISLMTFSAVRSLLFSRHDLVEELAVDVSLERVLHHRLAHPALEAAVGGFHCVSPLS